MPEPAWKVFERRVAEFFGSTRTPLSGGNGKVTRSDTFHPSFFLDAKLREGFVHHTILSDIKGKAKKEDKIPVLCTQKKRSPSFVVSLDKDDLTEFAITFLKSKGYIIKKRRES